MVETKNIKKKGQDITITLNKISEDDMQYLNENLLKSYKSLLNAYDIINNDIEIVKQQQQKISDDKLLFVKSINDQFAKFQEFSKYVKEQFNLRKEKEAEFEKNKERANRLIEIRKKKEIIQKIEEIKPGYQKKREQELERTLRIKEKKHRKKQNKKNKK